MVERIAEEYIQICEMLDLAAKNLANQTRKNDSQTIIGSLRKTFFRPTNQSRITNSHETKKLAHKLMCMKHFVATLSTFVFGDLKSYEEDRRVISMEGLRGMGPARRKIKWLHL